MLGTDRLTSFDTAATVRAGQSLDTALSQTGGTKDSCWIKCSVQVQPEAVVNAPGSTSANCAEMGSGIPTLYGRQGLKSLHNIHK